MLVKSGNPQERHDYFASRLSNGDNVIGFKNPSITIAPGETTTVSQRLYVGPKDQVALADLAENLDLVIDYGWLWWLAKPCTSAGLNPHMGLMPTP